VLSRCAATDGVSIRSRRGGSDDDADDEDERHRGSVRKRSMGELAAAPRAIMPVAALFDASNAIDNDAGMRRADSAGAGTTTTTTTTSKRTHHKRAASTSPVTSAITIITNTTERRSSMTGVHATTSSAVRRNVFG
jgi:hypothetical protein